jgi:hypothetical protein
MSSGLACSEWKKAKRRDRDETVGKVRKVRESLKLLLSNRRPHLHAVNSSAVACDGSMSLLALRVAGKAAEDLSPLKGATIVA